MRYVIGIDGGGTKTAFALAEQNGAVCAQTTLPSLSYREHGTDAVVARLREGTQSVLQSAGVSARDLCAAVVGAPGYGESPEGDVALRQAVASCFPNIRAKVVNDGLIACYGAFGGRPGINIVAGTGSVAFGTDARGTVARSGGWSEHFSDEGSCYWLGKQAMGLFCKESDGRAPRGALYDIFREKFNLQDDFSFIDVMERNWLPQRGKVAALQKDLLSAAQRGDAAAQRLYDEAARELAQLAVGVARQLHRTGTAAVSLTGGLLHAGQTVLAPLAERLKECNLQYHPCEGTPLDGAVAMARRLSEEACDEI